jgi:tetratricopeptide (TPR) repeat protein
LTIFFLSAAVFFLSACKEEIPQPIVKKKIRAELLKTTRSKEDHQEAIKNFKELLKKEPNNLVLLISLGNAYFDMGMDVEAIHYYLQSLNIYPDNVTVRTDLGTAFRRIGQPGKALQQYHESLKVDPRHSTTRYNIGVVLLWDKKDVEGAIHVWKELLRIDPYFILADEVRSNIKVLEKVDEDHGGKL